MEEIIKDELKEEKIEEIKKKLTEVLDLTEMEELVKSNEKIFEDNGVTYKVRKPTYKEKQEVYQKRVEKFTELLNNEKYSLEMDLKKTYLKRGIDIDEMSSKMSNKIKRRDELMLQLGELVKNSASEEDLKKFKTEIQEIQEEIKLISINKTSLLEFSIENQVLIHTYSYLTYLVSEKKEGDNWVKVWKSFDDFQNDSTTISNKLAYYVTLISSLE
jgi:hypothetical protein